MQRKLEMLNNIMDQEARAEQARRQMQYFGCEYILVQVVLNFMYVIACIDSESIFEASYSFDLNDCKIFQSK